MVLLKGSTAVRSPIRRLSLVLFEMYFELIILGVLSFYLIKWVKFRLQYDLHKIPSPPQLPIVGHLHHFLFQKHLKQNQFVLEWYEKLNRPKVMLKTIPGDSCLIVFDMEFVKNKVLGRDEMPRHKIYSNLRSVLVGDKHPWNLSLTTPKITPFTQTIRKAISKSFSSTHIRNAFDDLKSVVKRALVIVEEKSVRAPVDLQPIFGQLATDIIGKVGFDLNLGGLDQSGRIYNCFIKSFECFVEKIFKPHYRLLAHFWPNSSVGKRWRIRQETIFNEHEKIIEKIWSRPYPEEENVTLWANLRRVIDPETGQSIEKKKIAGELITIVGAAMDTSGHQLGWIFAILSDHEHVINKLITDMEALGLYGPNARELEFIDLASLPYLTAIIKECMRICVSISVVTHRCTKEDMTIFGFRVPKGTQIYIPSNVYCKMEEYCEEPMMFKPERWLGPNSPEQAFLAFSHGPRDCAGQRLAMLEMQITVLLFIQKFKIKLSGGKTFKEIEEKYMYESIMMEAEGGLVFDIEERNQTQNSFH